MDSTIWDVYLRCCDGVSPYLSLLIHGWGSLLYAFVFTSPLHLVIVWIHRLVAWNWYRNLPASFHLTFSDNWIVLWIETQGTIFVVGFNGSAQVPVLLLIHHCPVWSMAYGHWGAELSTKPPMDCLCMGRTSRWSKAGSLLQLPMSCLCVLDIIINYLWTMSQMSHSGLHQTQRTL